MQVIYWGGPNSGTKLHNMTIAYINKALISCPCCLDRSILYDVLAELTFVQDDGEVQKTEGVVAFSCGCGLLVHLRFATDWPDKEFLRQSREALVAAGMANFASRLGDDVRFVNDLFSEFEIGLFCATLLKVGKPEEQLKHLLTLLILLVMQSKHQNLINTKEFLSHYMLQERKKKRRWNSLCQM